MAPFVMWVCPARLIKAILCCAVVVSFEIKTQIDHVSLPL